MKKINYSIKELIAQFGITKIIKSLDFIGAVLCTIIYIRYVIITPFSSDIEDLLKNLLANLLSVSSSLFSILFAAFAIILTLADERFLKFLKQQNVLDKILLPFWLVSMLYIINIITNIATIFFNGEIIKYLIGFSVFTFSWAIFGTIFLVNDTINFSRRRADFLEYEKEIKKVLKKEG